MHDEAIISRHSQKFNKEVVNLHVDHPRSSLFEEAPVEGMNTEASAIIEAQNVVRVYTKCTIRTDQGRY